MVDGMLLATLVSITRGKCFLYMNCWLSWTSVARRIALITNGAAIFVANKYWRPTRASAYPSEKERNVKLNLLLYAQTKNIKKEINIVFIK